MSRWNIRRKLSPAKRAWKNFTKKLQPNIIHFINLINKHSSNIKTSCHHLLYILHSFLPTKFRSISSSAASSHRRFYHNYSHHHHNQAIYNNFSAIHIDELFPYSASATTSASDIKKSNIVSRNTSNNITMHRDEAGTSSNDNSKENDKGKKVAVGDKDIKRVSSSNNKQSIYSVEEAWMAVVAASPQLRGVDERAEEFISNFREDMKLQKEKSLLEFQEMLKRSA
ncbi:hypothetical protein G4B88_003143 [Cannabis sativa]|uniref:Cotton fiber protein n=1 Tax=Cannabis sativa TaxID=3483 RepID=A0A7J6DT81_CANSA|nr:hypothetical protein G4B88_003143 [Cannabis sativa]